MYRLTKYIVLIMALQACSEPLRKLDSMELYNQENRIRQLLVSAVVSMEENTADSYKQAEASLFLALEAKPDDARVFDGLGCLELRRKNFEEALSYFKRSMELAPDYDRPYAHAAEVAMSRSDWQSAIDLYGLALEINPLNYPARNNYAVLLYQLGLIEEAKFEFQKAKAASGSEDNIIGENVLQIQYASDVSSKGEVR